MGLIRKTDEVHELVRGGSTGVRKRPPIYRYGIDLSECVYFPFFILKWIKGKHISWQILLLAVVAYIRNTVIALRMYSNFPFKL